MSIASEIPIHVKFIDYRTKNYPKNEITDFLSCQSWKLKLLEQAIKNNNIATMSNNLWTYFLPEAYNFFVFLQFPQRRILNPRRHLTSLTSIWFSNRLVRCPLGFNILLITSNRAQEPIVTEQEDCKFSTKEQNDRNLI